MSNLHGTYQRRYRLVGALVIGSVILFGLRLAYAIEIPPTGSIAFIQTSGPNAELSTGDFYSNARGANEPHIVKFIVSCEWPADVPVTVALFDPESQLPDPVRPSAIDEIDGAADDTTFTLKSPDGSTIQSVTYTPDGGTNGLWVEFVTFTPDTDGYGCGEYALETRTSDDDEQSWRLSVANDPDCTVSTNGPGSCSGIGQQQSDLLDNGNETDDADGVPGTGDIIEVTVQQVAFQHAGSECQDFYFFVGADQTEITLHNFDMDIDDIDPTATVNYFPPTPPGEPERRIPGTVSGNNQWNNGDVPPPFPPERVGDTFTLDPGRDIGLWRAELCAADKNQYVFESGSDLFYQPPPMPEMQVAKDDGVSVTQPNSMLTYTITFTNTSDTMASPGSATNVVLTDQLPTNVTYQSCTINAPYTGTCTENGGVVTAEINDLVVAGASGSIQITVQVNPDATGTVVNEIRLDYQDPIGNQYMPAFDDDIDTIQSSPVLQASKQVSSTSNDLDNGCEALSGEKLIYTIVITNSGSMPAVDIIFDDIPDANTRLIAGSVQTSRGTVTRGNVSGDTDVRVSIGTLDANDRITITYETIISEPLPTNQVTIVNQGRVSGSNVDITLTDDPTTMEPNDPTEIIGCQKTPASIVLERFTATRQADTMTVRWTTSAEIDTWGFHLYRSTTGSRSDATQVTSDLILARGRGQGGADYTWIDTSANQGETYTYWLHEIEVDGTVNEYGPANSGALTDDWRIVLPIILR